MDWLWLSCRAMSVMVVFKCVHDFINNRLRLENVTPMALMHVFGNLMGFMPCYNLAHFTLQSGSFCLATNQRKRRKVEVDVN